MKNMSQDNQIQCQLHEFFHSRCDGNSLMTEEAVNAHLQYRQTLNDEERQHFDTAILQGWNPERAVSMVEYIGGRDSAARNRNAILTGKS
jgi:hypothetical protein